MNAIVSSENETKYPEVINGIDSMCQVQLGQIGAIVTSMLRAMETPPNFGGIRLSSGNRSA